MSPTFPDADAAGAGALDIVIPVYNQACFLAACLDSVVHQTVGDWEAIVIDDKSTVGDVGAIVAGFRDPRFSDRKSTRLNSSHIQKSRMPSSA